MYDYGSNVVIENNYVYVNGDEVASVDQYAEQAEKLANRGRKAKPAKDTNTRTALGMGSLAGNLTADPELRYTSTGRAVCKMRIAYTPRQQNPETNNWVDGPAQFFDVTAWGKLGEHCAEHRDAVRGHFLTQTCTRRFFGSSLPVLVSTRAQSEP